MTPRRRLFAAILVGIGALIYGISPIDLIPDYVTGPIGSVDDGAVWIGAAIAIWKLLSGRASNDDETTPTES